MPQPDQPVPTVVVRPASMNTAVLIAGVLHSFGRQGRDWVAGTLLPDGRFLDGDLAQCGPIEWIREWTSRHRRLYELGFDPGFDTDWVESDEANSSLMKIIAAVGLQLPVTHVTARSATGPSA